MKAHADLRMALAALSLGCGCAATEPEASSSEHPPAWGTAEAVVDLRVGVAEGDDAYLFGRIQDIAVGNDGAIFVADRQVNVVRMFDRGGRFVRDVGRAGQGPGEYARIVGMKVLPDGRLAMRDIGNQRIAFFSAQGEALGQMRVASSTWGSHSLEFDVAGNLYVSGVLDFAAPESEWSAVLQTYAPNSHRLDDVPLPAPDQSPSGRGVVLQTSQGMVQDFPIATLFDWSPLGYLVVGRNDEYAVRLATASDSVVLARAVPRVRIGEEERDNWEALAAWVQHRYRDQGLDVQMRTVADVKPLFRGIYVGDEGRIWVHRYVEAVYRDVPVRTPGMPPFAWREPTTFDVFEPSGVFLGTVTLPDDIHVLVWRGDQMWGVHSDAEYVERVVRLRVETRR